jgi:hypothetical protein
VVGRTEAHQRGLLMARQSAVRWLTTTAQTSGCQSRTYGREAPENNEEACGAVSRLVGGRSTVVDSNPLTEEEAIKDEALPGVTASGSSLKVLVHLQRKTTVRVIGSDGDGVGWGGTRR